MSGKTHSETRSPFSLGIPRDYLDRRRLFRKVSGVAMIVMFSLLVAGLLVYALDPTLSFLH